MPSLVEIDFRFLSTAAATRPGGRGVWCRLQYYVRHYSQTDLDFVFVFEELHFFATTSTNLANWKTYQVVSKVD